MPAVERMKPLLGTFVAIRAEADFLATEIEAAVDSAFRAIEQVERLMSFHRSGSDIARLNRALPGAYLRVHRWTYAVLAEAQRLCKLSGGLFDCNVGQSLRRAQLLPRNCITPAPRRRRPPGRAIQLRANQMIRVNDRVALDLGGIAKGFAVDQAVKALQAKGVATGVVNAGGDLRVFGDTREPVWVRRPSLSGELELMGMLTHGAVATSGSYFLQTAKTYQDSMTAIVNPLRGRRVSTTRSVSVVAKNCLLADALTKIAVIRHRLPAALMRSAQASIIML